MPDAPPVPARPRAVLFDMDGTLTRPCLDFDAIRADMGITGPILEAMRHMTGDRLAECWAILDRHESRAALDSELNDGCHDVLAWLHEHAIRTALITRNSRASVRTVLDRHDLRFEHILSREDEPTKPHPAPLLRACALLGLSKDDAWMVGDGSHDVDAGIAAGIRTVWVSHDGPKDFPAEPWRTVSTLHGLIELLRSTTIDDA